MIVVDSSALIAILEKEADAARYAAEIAKADRLLISGRECARNRDGPAYPPRSDSGGAHVALSPGRQRF